MQKITPEEIKSRLSISQVLGYYGISINKSSKITCPDPAHADKNPSCVIDTRMNLWHCKSCDAKGNIFHLIAHIEEKDMKTSFGWVLQKANEISGAAPAIVKEAKEKKRRSGRVVSEDIKSPPPLNGWGQPIDHYPYKRIEDGPVLFKTVRHERVKEDGKREKRMITYTVHQNKLIDASPEPLLPFYPVPAMLSKLGDRILVEGEKTAKVVYMAKVPNVITACHSFGMEKTDWSLIKGKDIRIVPDTDIVGLRKALKQAKFCSENGAKSVGVVFPDFGYVEKGWDLADAVKKGGWDADRIVKWTKANCVAISGLRHKLLAGLLNGAFVGTSETKDAEKLLVELGGELPTGEKTLSTDGDFGLLTVEKNVGDKMKPFRALGRTGDGTQAIAFMDCYNGDVFTKSYIALTNANTLLTMCSSLDWWMDDRGKFGVRPDDNNKGTLSREFAQKVGAAIIEGARRGRTYKGSLLRKVGIWLDQSEGSGKKLIMNFGNMGAVWDFTNKITYRDIPGIDVSEKMILAEDSQMQPSPIINDPLPNADSYRLLEVFDMWNWQKDFHSKMMLGFCFLAPIAGAIPFRPHGWITGATASGKSSLIERVIAPLTRDFNVRLSGNDTSHAGIRRQISGRGVIVLRDEAEQTSKATKENNDMIADIMRTSSYASDGPAVIKVKSDLQTEHFFYAAMFLNSSTQVPNMTLADSNRICHFHIARRGESMAGGEDKGELKDLPHGFDMTYGYAGGVKNMTDNLLTVDFIRRFQGRAIRQYPTIIKTWHIIRQKLIERGMNDRMGDLYGMLLAGYYCATQINPVLDDEFDYTLKSICSRSISQKSGFDNWEIAIKMILNHRIKVPARWDGDTFEHETSVSVMQLLYFASGMRTSVAPEALNVKQDVAQYILMDVVGIGVCEYGKQKGYVITAQNDDLNRMFKKDKFENLDYFHQLMQSPVATSLESVSIKGQNCPGIFFRLDEEGFNIGEAFKKAEII